ncbi:hypothetical protein ACFQDN_21695 [Pseudomonas asuensis]|uniref:Uncharacterized protein n=1 Tax=Pseudomonas asuensis TaxID=1825787 RepID=A0ABQ2H2U9_9PSED|nr:hypothetical protein [Pseudomonas asuensis]GGM25044.1 hypothetical protein GCM10009425_39840 [Pseudomonas asuensis]
MRSFFANAKTAIYVSEPDIQAALDHLRALPYSKADSTPRAWDRRALLIELQEQADKGAFQKVDDMQAIGPGVWALVKPLGADLLRMPEKPEGLQVWLLIRNVGTDPTALTEL